MDTLFKQIQRTQKTLQQGMKRQLPLKHSEGRTAPRWHQLRDWVLQNQYPLRSQRVRCHLHIQFSIQFTFSSKIYVPVKSEPHCPCKVLVTIVWDAISGSFSIKTLYACLTQSEQVIYVGTLGIWPVRSIGSCDTILLMLSVPTTASYSSRREVAQSVLFVVLKVHSELNTVILDIRITHSFKQAICWTVTKLSCTNVTISEIVLCESSIPISVKSTVHDVARVVTMSDSVWLVQGSWEQAPWSQLSIAGINDTFWPMLEKRDGRAPTLRQDASGEPATWRSADWQSWEREKLLMLRQKSEEFFHEKATSLTPMHQTEPLSKKHWQ